MDEINSLWGTIITRGYSYFLRPVYKGLFHKISKPKCGDATLGGHLNTLIRTLSLLVREILLYLLFSLSFFIAHTIHQMRPTTIANMITIPNHMLSHLTFPKARVIHNLFNDNTLRATRKEEGKDPFFKTLR
ncbi:MAG: hypothetical protein NTX30_21375, partial [Deltaproteobacteria bacterium]|nr:hypothetical protein [Deltaproteobacteria bacterium]